MSERFDEAYLEHQARSDYVLEAYGPTGADCVLFALDDEPNLTEEERACLVVEHGAWLIAKEEELRLLRERACDIPF